MYFRCVEEMEKLEAYRLKKLELLEEIKVLQSRQYRALENIAESIAEPSLMSLSPVIRSPVNKFS